MGNISRKEKKRRTKTAKTDQKSIPARTQIIFKKLEEPVVEKTEVQESLYNEAEQAVNSGAEKVDDKPVQGSQEQENTKQEGGFYKAGVIALVIAFEAGFFLVEKERIVNGILPVWGWGLIISQIVGGVSVCICNSRVGALICMGSSMAAGVELFFIWNRGMEFFININNLAVQGVTVLLMLPSLFLVIILTLILFCVPWEAVKGGKTSENK